MRKSLTMLCTAACLCVGCISSDDREDGGYIAAARYMRKLLLQYESVPVERVSGPKAHGSSPIRVSLVQRERYIQRHEELWSDLSCMLEEAERISVEDRFSDDAVFLLAHAELIQSCAGTAREHLDACLEAFERYVAGPDERQIEYETYKILGSTQLFSTITAGLAALPEELPESDKLLLYALFQEAKLYRISDRTDAALGVLARIRQACSDSQVSNMVAAVADTVSHDAVGASQERADAGQP